MPKGGGKMSSVWVIILTLNPEGPIHTLNSKSPKQPPREPQSQEPQSQEPQLEVQLELPEGRNLGFVGVPP